MPSKFNFSAAFIAVVLSLTAGCERREEEDDAYYDNGTGVYYHGVHYPYGQFMPGGYRSSPNMGGNSIPSGSRIVKGSPPARSSAVGTSRGGFGARGVSSGS